MKMQKDLAKETEVRGGQKNKKLDSELAHCFFPSYYVSGVTKKNFQLPTYGMALVCIPEALTHLLTPMLPYLDIENVGYQMRHLCQKCQKYHI